MKINLKNVALVILAIGGGVGASVAAIRSGSKTKSSSVANMSDSSMMSIQPDTSSCEMCSSGRFSNCTDGSCPQSESRMNMTTDNPMSMVGITSMGEAKATMGGEKMPEVSMANTMSPSMSDKAMIPRMGSAKMADAEQMTSVAPKM